MVISIRLGKFPYTYLRTIMMKKNLLSRQDYDKILKMTPNEIGKYLEEFEYKKEVDELAMDYKGIELVERTLQLNLGNNLGKLLRISSHDLKFLIKIYQKRYDIYNIKAILRSKFNNMPVEDAKKHLSPISVEKKDFFDKLIAQKTVEEVISGLGFLDENQLRSAAEHFKNNKSLMYIENTLDRYYFRFVISQLAFLSSEGKLYKKFLLNEIDIMNIKLILRLKREGMPEQSIKELIFGFGNITKQDIDKMLKGDAAAVIKELGNTQFKEVAEKYSKTENINFTELEMDLDKFLLQQSKKLTRQHPLSVDIIMGYMFLKDIEVKNLTRIIKAKQLGLTEDFIEKTIVV
ncbi:MAG TPA: V-type ATPase subunit [Candidatus Woesearchaeota archaeon]|jgi:V/A-type H+-transporting ATPase subunit C|nr:V-type ATPase subunit [Candidatus Woesearchaeota archaeon]HJN56492.1 V-type ATPase subunit [Candidatus Woesearchaeota archaeon]|tara:strand:- start:11802 stop:12845 length:1044 start_codon:yes stop_codon:yes gene_type:complete